MNFHIVFDFGRLRLEWERHRFAGVSWCGRRRWELARVGRRWFWEGPEAAAMRLASQAA